ncbi:MAG: glycosyltransferase [Clostridiales bacterium]|nr:glycosyltransferase [Clostridiales bacterium]
MKPMVSICCAAYNQEQFIGKTLDGFLAQTVDFPIEILIHDDASTDQTPMIIRDYAERYPEMIKPILQTENQYSKGVAIDPTFNYSRAEGRYIALCEGDDYWCDPMKLQRQVDYMQSHPDCTFCFTNGYIHDVNEQRPDREFIPYYEKERSAFAPADRTYTAGEMCELTFVPTASFLFPSAVLDMLPRSYWDRHCPHGDLKLRLFCAAAGYGYYQHAFTCMYRENVAGGAMSQWSADGAAKVYQRSESVAQMLADVDEFSKKKYTDQVGRFRDWYLYVMLWNAPERSAAKDVELGRIYRSLSVKQRMTFHLKHLLPRTFIDAVKRIAVQSNNQ